MTNLLLKRIRRRRRRSIENEYINTKTSRLTIGYNGN